MANSFITNVNKLANTLDGNITKIEELKTQTFQAKTESIQAKEQAVQASQSAQINANNIVQQLNREATETLLGSVILASDTDIAQGTNKVITAKKLKPIIDDLKNKTNIASTVKEGIIKVATVEEIKNKTGNNAITPENIQHLTLSLDMTNYYTHQIIGSINFVILKVSDTVSYLQGFGRIITNNSNTVKIVFPKPVITQHIGINFNIIGNSNNKAIIEEITSNYCIVSIRNNTNNLIQDTGSFTMQALIDNEVTPIAPVDVQVTATGDNVTIRWQD